MCKQRAGAAHHQHPAAPLRASLRGAAALEEISEGDYLDCINFLAEAGYIALRNIYNQQPAELADTEDYRDLEAKLTAQGIRLIGGEITDKMVKA